MSLCYQTFVSRMGSGYVSTVTEWLSGASPGSPWRAIDVGSICTVTRLGPGGRAAVLGHCSITATQSSSSNALGQSNKTLRIVLWWSKDMLKICCYFKMLFCFHLFSYVRPAARRSACRTGTPRFLWAVNNIEEGQYYNTVTGGKHLIIPRKK